MPSIDQDAKRWQAEFAARVGVAVRDRRKRLGLTAQQLATMTEDRGYPITRVAISKIESNSRSGKLDVAELVILAAALDIPPILLLFPDFPDGEVELVPGEERSNYDAAGWFSGVLPGPSSDGQANGGVHLVQAARRHLEKRMDAALARAREATDGGTAELAEVIAKLKVAVAVADQQVKLMKANMWGDDV